MQKTNGAVTPFPGEAVAAIDQMFAKLQHALPGFNPRSEQVRMANVVAQTLVSQCDTNSVGNGSHLTVCEGQTGTGKTFAYLTGGLYAAKHTGKRLVISTATVGLQEQIAERDLPFFVKHITEECRSGIAKGRTRYVCLTRLMHQHANGAHDLVFGDTASRTGDGKVTLEKLRQAIQDGWNGDRDSWPEPIPEDLWQSLTTDRHGCTKRRCPFLENCPYYKARNHLRDANVIITNHDLLLSDLELGGGLLLPKPAETIYVVDEAHHLPEKAIQRFTETARLTTLEHAIERAPRTAAMVVRELRLHQATTLAHGIRDCAAQATRAVSELFDDLNNYGTLQMPGSTSADHDLPLVRFPRGELPPHLIRHAENIRAANGKLHERLTELREMADHAVDQGDIRGIRIGPMVAALGAVTGRLVKTQRLWDLLLEQPEANEAPIAKWLAVEEHRGRLDYIVEASRVNAGRILHDCFWSRASAAIATSATLTVGGEFKYFAHRSGLSTYNGVRYERFNSPFDYSNKARIEVPSMVTTPMDDQSYLKEVATLLPNVVNPTEGTLVLFTSHRQMREVLGHLDQSWRSSFLVQHERSRESLLATHSARIEKGDGSVLCGLQSFGEGLDLPGALCRHVVIVKLPFGAPDNPVEQALSEWISAQGRNPFMEIQVPKACVRLVQNVGRLLRSEQDFGRITILDKRILTKGYGRTLVKSLPPIPINSSGERVVARGTR